MAATIAPNGTLRAREPRAYTLVLRGRSPGHCLPKAPWGRHGGAFSAVGTPRARCDHGSHVVVVNFWTLTCINWLRQEPYVRAWSQAYRNDGLVVIGVHTPEFSFEHVISDHHFGEGRYEQSERVIQRLLGVERELVLVEGRGVEAAADWDHLGTPETYLGYARGDRFASPNGAALGESRAYEPPERLRFNQWALAGEWTIRVLLDGDAPGGSRGVDVDKDGNGVLQDDACTS